MSQTIMTPEAIKLAVKEAFVETLHEHRDLFRDVIAEILEDFALVTAIEEGRETELVDREAIFKLFDETHL